MGNCCTNEMRTDMELNNHKIENNPKEKKKMVSNYNTNNVVNHAPQNQKKADQMNPTSPNVERIIKNLKKFQKPVKLNKKFKHLPELGPYVYREGESYLGQYNEGDREGFGVQIWPDGSIYEGYWLKDKFSDFGRFVHKEGDYYVGTWKEGMANGKGKLVHTDGSEYEGDWVMDEKSGKGKQVWKDGSMYEGEFKNNAINGFGKKFIFFMGFRHLHLD